MNLAVYATGHGYGHLTRILEIARIIKDKYPDVKIHVRAPYPQKQVYDSLGFLSSGEPCIPDSFEPVRLDIGLIQKDSLRMDFESSLEKLQYYFGESGDKLVEKEAEWLNNNNINAALIDIPPRAFDACGLAGIPAYGMSNFSWDWIWKNLSDDHEGFKRYADKASESYSSCKILFRTVMSAGLDAFPVQEEIPLVARISDRDSLETRKLLGIPNDKPVVILSYGGEGLKDVKLPPSSLHQNFTFVITEPMENQGDQWFYLSDADVAKHKLRYCDLVKAADIVMTKPGYSTVAECTCNKTALVYTDRGPFAEYPYSVKYIEDFLPNVFLPSDDLFAGRWENSLIKLQEKMPFEFPETGVNGAEVVADRLYEEMDQ